MSVIPVAVLATAIVLADHGVKWLLRRALAGRAISLGPAGSIALVRSRMWVARAEASRRVIGAAWLVAVSCLLALTTMMPAASLWIAALVGGSASHALETAVRGSISDYICLRFWPAFNLADVAITTGAIGVLFTLVDVAIR